MVRVHAYLRLSPRPIPLRATLWVFRVVGVCWIALSILALAGEWSPSRGATGPPEEQVRRGKSPTSASGGAKNGAGAEQTRVIAALLDETNRARRDHGLPTLALSEDLSAAARRHAEDMLARGYFSHDSPEGTGPSDRLREYAPRAIVLSLRENITKTEGDSGEGSVARSREVVEGWLRSKAHRENLLSPESAQVGFGIAWKGRENGRVEYTVQMLGVVAGHWEVAPESKIRTPSSWGMTLDSPLEFFLKDLTRTGKSYADPDGKPGAWVGGVPLTVSRAGGRRSVIFPRLDPGRYQLMGRRPTESGWQLLRDVTVGP